MCCWLQGLKVLALPAAYSREYRRCLYIYIYRERESIHNASTNINFINT